MYVLDTNVLSELVKLRPNAPLLQKLRDAEPDALFTTSVTVMELRYGSMIRADRERFWQRLVREVLARVEILGFGAAEALRAGDLLAHIKRQGQPVGIEDALIAAIALERDFSVVTRNVKHFDRVPGLRVENWFEA